MNGEVTVLRASPTLGVVLLIGVSVALSPSAAADPVMAPGYWAELFAEVPGPVYLSFNQAGHLFVGNSTRHGRIHRVSPDGSMVVPFGDPLPDPDGVVVDEDGSVASGPGYVLVGGMIGRGVSYVAEIAPDETTTWRFLHVGPELSNPAQMVFDEHSMLLYANLGSGAVGTVALGSPAIFSWPLPKRALGVAIDEDGWVYVSASWDGTIKLLAPDGTLVDGAFVSGLGRPTALALDTEGDFGGGLFVADEMAQAVLRVDLPGGGVTPVATGMDVPSGLTFGPDGTLYVSEAWTDKVWRFHRGLVTVEIDIKPGSDPNSVNPDSKGVIPVAIFSSPTFDATDVDPATVELAGASVATRGGKHAKYMAHEEYVNGDELMDLVVHVRTSELDVSQIVGGWAKLTGMTFSGQEFQGWDQIRLVPPH